MSKVDNIVEFLNDVYYSYRIHDEGEHPLGGRFERWLYKEGHKFESVELYVIRKDGNETFDIIYTLDDNSKLHMKSLNQLKTFLKVWETRNPKHEVGYF